MGADRASASLIVSAAWTHAFFAAARPMYARAPQQDIFAESTSGAACCVGEAPRGGDRASACTRQIREDMRDYFYPLTGEYSM